MRVIYHEIFMNEAIKEAQKAKQAGEIPVGCVIVQNKTIIARAHNQVESICDPLAHAEMLAMRSAIFDLHKKSMNGCTIYTTLEPCGMCAGAIARLRPSLCVFGAFDERFGCLVSSCDLPNAMGIDVPAIGGVCEAECTLLLSDFFAALRSRTD